MIKTRLYQIHQIFKILALSCSRISFLRPYCSKMLKFFNFFSFSLSQLSSLFPFSFFSLSQLYSPSSSPPPQPTPLTKRRRNADEDDVVPRPKQHGRFGVRFWNRFGVQFGVWFQNRFGVRFWNRFVDGVDGYGGAAVDLASEVHEGEVVVEGWEVWVLSWFVGLVIVVELLEFWPWSFREKEVEGRVLIWGIERDFRI